MCIGMTKGMSSLLAITLGSVLRVSGSKVNYDLKILVGYR